MVPAIQWLWENIAKLSTASTQGGKGFLRAFLKNLDTCTWAPHPLYSVFTQYDQEYYVRKKGAFLHKYRCFYAVGKTVSPRTIIELGTCAGSGADAYLSAAPEARYIGFDFFGVTPRHDDSSPWDPHEVAKNLLQSRGFKNYELIRGDLRKISTLPCSADFVVVDAAHDFDNEYADLNLALTANPDFIFIDDANDRAQAKPAIKKFLQEKVKVDYAVNIKYRGGGLVIKLKK